MAEGGAHDAGLAAHQLLVHMQGHGGGGVGEAQGRAEERRGGWGGGNRCKIITKHSTFTRNGVGVGGRVNKRIVLDASVSLRTI